MPFLYLIGGPNGSGKSTLSADLLQQYNLTAFDWDKEFYSIWKNFNYDISILDGVRSSTSNQFLEYLQNGYRTSADLAFETNLNSREIFKHVDKAKSHGYIIILLFLLVDKLEICIERVAKRVNEGGHSVIDEEIIERYWKGLEILENEFHQFDQVYIYNASENFKITGLTKNKERIYELIDLLKNNQLDKFKTDFSLEGYNY